MFIRGRRKEMNISGTMCINGNVIEQVDSASFVGIVFDNHPLYVHIDIVNKTTNRSHLHIIYIHEYLYALLGNYMLRRLVYQIY